MTRWFSGFLVAALCLLHNVQILRADKPAGEFTIDGKGFYYMTKFGCSRGDCSYKLRFRLVDLWNTLPMRTESVWDSLSKAAPSVLHLRVFLDEEWDSPPVNRNPTCDDLHRSRARTPVLIPLTSSWSDWVSGNVRQVVRPHVWYFLADDCLGTLSQSLATALSLPPEKIRTLKIGWEAVMTQQSGSHFSHEYRGSSYVTLFHIVCYAIVLYYTAFRQVREMRNSGKLHLMLQMLNLCLITQLASSVLHLMHAVSYRRTGVGFPKLDVFSEALSVTSQIVLSTVLILIARGYSLNLTTTGPPTLHKRPTFAVVFCVTLIHVLLVIVDHLHADPRFRFHKADGLIGPTFTVLRVALWALFVRSCTSTAYDPNTSMSAARFLRRFIWPGSLYFLAYPLVLGLTMLFPPYLKHRVLNNGFFLMQLCSMSWLCSLFLSRGDYFKASELSQSYLPGGYFPARGRHLLD